MRCMSERICLTYIKLSSMNHLVSMGPLHGVSAFNDTYYRADSITENMDFRLDAELPGCFHYQLSHNRPFSKLVSKGPAESSGI